MTFETGTAERAAQAVSKPSAFTDEELGQFVEGYLLSWLFFEPLPPPDEDEHEDWWEGDSYLDGGGFKLDDLTARRDAISVVIAESCWKRSPISFRGTGLGSSPQNSNTRGTTRRCLARNSRKGLRAAKW